MVSSKSQPNSSISALKKREKKFLRFNLLFFFWVALPLFAIGGFNLLIDPYGIYSKKLMVQGLNHYKPIQENNDRLYKAIEVIDIKPNTILLGSSRTKIGLSPYHPALSSLKPVYNLGLNDANMYELRRYLEHTLFNNKNLKRVVLGLDFYMFNQNLENKTTFAEYRLNKKHLFIKDILDSTLSLQALSASNKTFIESSKRSQSKRAFSRHGFVPHLNVNDRNTVIRFQGSTSMYFSLHSDYSLSSEYIDEFQKVVDLCRENKIELIAYFSPVHAIRLQSIYASGKWSVFEDWKRKMVDIVPVWEFSNYNAITTEPLEDRMENYFDESHYNKPIGDLILNRVLEGEEEGDEDGFGVLLTGDNIESVLSQNRLDREKWAKERANEVEFVQSIQSNIIAQEQKKH